jgi:exoribonuclease-2
LALIEALQGSKVRLKVGFDARSQVLPQRQLELLARLPAGVPPALRLDAEPWGLSPAAIAAARPGRRAWGTAWLLLLESGENPGISEFADLVCGSSSPAPIAACWFELVGGQMWFRLRQGRIGARPASELRHLRQERRRRTLQEQQEQQWLELLRRRHRLDPAQCTPLQQHRLAQLQQLAAGHLEPADLEAPLRHSLTNLHLELHRGPLRHLLVDLGLWDPHHLVSIAGTAWSSGFSGDLEAEAARLVALHTADRPGDGVRRDLTGQRCLTIDDDDTVDLDDGLALERCSGERLRLWIHVADPGRLIDFGSPLDLEARRRGSSLYLARGTLPMFPEPLSIGPMSLRAGVRTAAWSTWAELDDRGAISACGIVRSWVKPALRLSYGDADDLLDLAPAEEGDLLELNRLLQRRRQWRLQQGALLLDLPEGRIRSQNHTAVLEITEPTPARQLVAEAMILAGAVAARFGTEQGLALPFRAQLPAELPPAPELAALPEGPVRFAAIKRCLSRGLMGTRPAPHFSLGLPAYVQATSPIRRYGDLLVQRQIAAHLEGRTPLDEAQLQEQLDILEKALRDGIGIAREDQRHWQQVWFEAHRQGQWRAQFLRWLRPQDRLGLVRPEELAMDLACECPAQVAPGALLLLRVQQVDSLRDQLRLVASAS